MLRILLFIVLSLFAIVGNLEAKNLKKNKLKDASLPSNPQDITAFDYVYATAPRRYSHSHGYSQKSSHIKTTPRPFVRYWQNLPRNVRLTVPFITWNATNPLTNLFNAANEGYAPIEKEFVDDYYFEHGQRRHKNKKRRRQNNKRYRKHKRPHEHTAVEHQFELENAAQHMLLPQYAIDNKIDINSPMYFYHPNTGAYYAVQRVRAFGSYIDGTNIRHESIKRQEIEQSSNKAADNINDEAEEIDLDQVAKNEPTPATANNIHHQIEDIDKPKNDFLYAETLRNVLGTFMYVDLHNRQKQRSKEKENLSHKQIKPRKQLSNFILLDVN